MTETENVITEMIIDGTLDNKTISSLETPIETIKPTIKVVTMSDFETIDDSIESESEMIERYNKQLVSLKDSDKLQSYKDGLIETKRKLAIKKTSYQFIINEKPVLKEYWDSTLNDYLKIMGFKAQTEERQESILVKNSKTKTYETKEVTNVYLLNSLKNANEHSLSYTLEFIIEHYDISDVLKADFTYCLESLKDHKEDIILSGHTIKANSELFNDASAKIKEDIKNVKLNKKFCLTKTQASIDFINWKLKQIKTFELQSQITDSDKKLIDLNAKIETKLKEDKKFASLAFIANKFGL